MSVTSDHYFLSGDDIRIGRHSRLERLVPVRHGYLHGKHQLDPLILRLYRLGSELGPVGY